MLKRFILSDYNEFVVKHGWSLLFEVFFFVKYFYFQLMIKHIIEPICYFLLLLTFR